MIPENVHLYEEAVKLAGQGEFGRALGTLKQIKGSDAAGTAILYGKALCEYNLGQYSEALYLSEMLLAKESSEKAIELKREIVGKISEEKIANEKASASNVKSVADVEIASGLAGPISLTDLDIDVDWKPPPAILLDYVVEGASAQPRPRAKRSGGGERALVFGPMVIAFLWVGAVILGTFGESQNIPFLTGYLAPCLRASIICWIPVCIPPLMRVKFVGDFLMTTACMASSISAPALPLFMAFVGQSFSSSEDVALAFYMVTFLLVIAGKVILLIHDTLGNIAGFFMGIIVIFLCFFRTRRLAFGIGSYFLLGTCRGYF